jgi:hypothetical protein
MTNPTQQEDGGLTLRDRIAMEHLVRTLDNNAFFCSMQYGTTPETRQTYIQQCADNAFRAADQFLAARDRTEADRVPVDYRPHAKGPWKPARSNQQEPSS